VDGFHTTKRRLAGALALGLLPAWAGHAVAGTPAKIRAYKPEADTYVTAAEPGRNFGRTQALRADGEPQSTVFLRFQIGELSSTVESVTLLLHGREGGRSFQVRRVSQDEWREARLTYRNAPKLSLRYAASKPVRRGKWSAVDVTALISQENDREVSLAITTRSPLGLVFASRESKHGPRLVVTSERSDKDEKDKSSPRQARLPHP
jgi:hypothetical protein